MTCNKVHNKLFTDYIDGRCAPAERTHIEQHLVACPDCLERAALLKHIDQDLAPEPMPERLQHEVWQRIRQKLEERPVSWGERLVDWWEGVAWGLNPRPVFGSALAGVLVMLVVMVPLITRHQSDLARQDSETVIQLVYADDEPWEPILSGTIVEQLL